MPARISSTKSRSLNWGRVCSGIERERRTMFLRVALSSSGERDLGVLCILSKYRILSHDHSAVPFEDLADAIHVESGRV